MTSSYLPVLLVSVSTNAVPDDSALGTLPRGQVDYLSHDWQEEDVWRSWRNMTRQKNAIANGARLENASWRTWWKQRNKTQDGVPRDAQLVRVCVGPLALGAGLSEKPADMNPLQAQGLRCHLAIRPSTHRRRVDSPSQARADPRRPLLARGRKRAPRPLRAPAQQTHPQAPLDQPAPHVRLPPAGDVTGSFRPRRAMTKRRKSRSSARGALAARLGAGVNGTGKGKRPVLPHTKSDTHIMRWGASRAFRPDSPPRIDPPGFAAPEGLHPSVSQDSSTSSGTGGGGGGQPKKKHISFNTFVEQYIAVEKPKKNASGFFGVGNHDEDGVWIAGRAGFVDDDGCVGFGPFSSVFLRRVLIIIG